MLDKWWRTLILWMRNSERGAEKGVERKGKRSRLLASIYTAATLSSFDVNS
jgi:hypothetical protein